MNIKDALRTNPRKKKNNTFHQLLTPWGEKLDKNQLHSEYPRPQLIRNNYTMLCGEWDYAITKEPIKPFEYDGKILVPFSPEAYLSGVSRQVMPEDYLWYEREVVIHRIPKKRLILHFGAVDQYCEVYVNDIKIGSHLGGYLPFSYDITPYINDGANRIHLMVTDSSDTSYHSRGKQKLKRGGMFYTAQSGIWQSVWYEWVPEIFISKLFITPLYDEAKLKLQIILDTYTSNPKDSELNGAYIKIAASKEIIYEDTIPLEEDGIIEIPIKKVYSWSPETPFLYDMSITVEEDNIDSYFAMRKISIGQDDKGITRIFLNNKPYFQNGILDQGYWPDGLYTAPSDEAFCYDIQKMKDLGFCMIRKHIKIEPLRWYYHCDRLGMLVWQDMVNGGGKYRMEYVTYLPTVFPNLKYKDNRYHLLARGDKAGRDEFLKECKETIEHLYSIPSIVTWVPFNEGWGQFDASSVVAMIRKLDSTRLIDEASGWFDQNGGDMKSVHNYFRKLSVTLEKERAFVLSEFGGYACYLEGHSYSHQIYGYRIYKDIEKFQKAFHKLYQEDVFPLIEQGLCAAVYTQLSDVEDEVNGLISYDRKVCKVDKDPFH